MKYFINYELIAANLSKMPAKILEGDDTEEFKELAVHQSIVYNV